MSRLPLPVSAVTALAIVGGSLYASANDGTGGLPGQAISTQAEISSRLDVTITREVFVPGDIKDVFDFVAAEDVLPKVLTGYGLVPGVVSTSNVTGPWDRPGSNRTVHLADGSTAHEAVTDYTRPSYFAYHVSDPTFSLRYLMSGARGQWWLTPADGGTQVRWAYTFKAKSPVTFLPLIVFAHAQWSGYMNVCLENVRKHFFKAI